MIGREGWVGTVLDQQMGDAAVVRPDAVNEQQDDLVTLQVGIPDAGAIFPLYSSPVRGRDLPEARHKWPGVREQAAAVVVLYLQRC